MNYIRYNNEDDDDDDDLARFKNQINVFLFIPFIYLFIHLTPNTFFFPYFNF